MATVREVQQRLISLGYDVGPTGADGIPGRSTTKAVARFQEDKKLSILYPGTIG
ncbi:peptidoglycan-binding domain-containing protein, partial [Rhizobium pusense]